MAGDLTELALDEDDPFGEVAVALVAELAAEVDRRYADDGEGGDPTDDRDPATFRSPNGVFLVARLAGEPVACGALRRVDDGLAEIKRMYVRPAARGLGISRRILTELEARATALGYPRLRLETGLRQPEAMQLYESAGWTRIEPYGFYEDSPLTACYGKDLA